MKNGLFYRSFEIENKALNEKEKSVAVSFSSETPAVRWFGNEILLHGSKNVDLSRLKRFGAALLNHNPDTIVGLLKGINIKDRRGEASIIFDEDEDGQKAFGKVRSGSLKGVSVGYTVQKFREILQDEEYEEDGVKIKGPAFIATRWAPHEISLTPVPLDHNVGVGRALTRSLDGIDIIKSQVKENDMDKNEVQEMINRSIGKLAFAKPEDIPKVDDIANAVRSILTEESKPKMAVTTETLQDLLGRAGAVSIECKSKIIDMAVQGKTEPEMLRAITDANITDTDASDSGDKGNALEGKKKTNTRSRVTSFEQIDDKDFLGSICQPAITFN